MPTYISHITWTEQGIRSVKDSPKRLDAVKKQLKTLGVELKAFYVTQGTYDALLIFEVPNDTALAKLLLQVGSAGNFRTTTVRAYTEAEYREAMAGLSWVGARTDKAGRSSRLGIRAGEDGEYHGGEIHKARGGDRAGR